ncbi:IclR family transcriptional regulator C-terminal domain-containing protein [Pseudarthrobacter sp. lyk4-40-TYG-27]|uniref:IclR family transcriptional regulator n=1 Tax=Pseudarthrobacter sp. lyk4-40-TYG-27 TaxID=3040305 RepID=UPI00255781AE|nr:IclR family transcriptional regulator C-terminal domain-containing protein [Pseudarthrobacter sp. lyk4-40-TYG-27]
MSTDSAAAEASSLAQGLRLVRFVADREKRGRELLGVSQLAAELRMEQSRVSRLTQELCELGLLERGERGFRAGPGFFGLAASLNVGWIREAGAELEALVASLGLRARLSIREGFRVILLRNSTNDAVPGSFAAPGMVTPVWCTGAGRALLWDFDRAALDGLLADVNFIGIGGPGAAHSTDAIWQLLVRDRGAGFVGAHEEFEHGVTELAVPVRDGGGSVVAALSVLGSRDRVTPKAALAADALRRSADRLAAFVPVHD